MDQLSSRFKYLVQRKLDNILTLKEQREFEGLIAESEQARLYHEKMVRMHNDLLEINRGSQEIDISNEIMEVIMENKSHQASKQHGIMAKSTLKWQRIFKYAAVLLIGLMIGSAATYVYFKGDFKPDTGSAAATFSARSGQVYSFSGEGWKLIVNYFIIDKEISLFTTLQSSNMLEVNFEFNQQVFKILTHNCLGCNISPASNFGLGLAGFRNYEEEAVFKLGVHFHSGMRVPVPFTISQDGQIEYRGEIFIR